MTEDLDRKSADSALRAKRIFRYDLYYPKAKKF